ncbi:hypothetical protein QU481_03845 [Crenobacter sp. SG2303]|uniref:DUF5610 domain-containing protein n=1 Tax=Crenobacter oryzisoli TaxID=3056844 RepID=A0ABT7XJR4_9NEIS|nr:hypothetical protein [Crenobacter sp. SG2303]MDN0074021.1 hypothetical protein [Crenobacter sp. SG2303]
MSLLSTRTPAKFIVLTNASANLYQERGILLPPFARHQPAAHPADQGGRTMLTPNALHLAEHDGQLAALRVLYGLRWHLDAHDTSEDAQQAAIAFCEGFANVFAPLLAEAMEGAKERGGDAASILFALIAGYVGDLIHSLDR